MNRIESLSQALKPNKTIDNSSEATTNNDVIQQLIEKAQIILPHLIIPTWILSPLVCGYLFKIGSFNTRLNLFLVLIYQYFFTRKTQILKEILYKMKGKDYFKSYQLIIENGEVLQENNSLFTFHPHGYFANGMFLAHISNNTIKNSVIAGSRMALVYPWGGLIMKYFGVEGVNPENFENMLKKNENISVIPGGFEEATLTQFGKQRVFLKNRKGFIKLALKYGYMIYPVYTFGETNLHNSLSNEKLGLVLNKLKLPGTIPYSKNLILPNNDEELITVIGKGLQMPKIEKPTQDDVDKYHGIYVENLKRIYLKFKREGDGDLEIF